MKMKKEKNVVLAIRKETKRKLESALSDYIGRSGRRIPMTEYIDRLADLRLAADENLKGD